MSNIKDKSNIESSIIILTYKWKTKMLFSGYYDFEIFFTKKRTKSNKILAQRTMYRSYNDLKILYQRLILYNPGCLIETVPLKILEEQQRLGRRNEKSTRKLLGVSTSIYTCQKTQFF